jgi:hypothetical protein
VKSTKQLDDMYSNDANSKKYCFGEIRDWRYQIEIISVVSAYALRDLEISN